MLGIPSDGGLKDCSGGSLARVFVFAKLNRNAFTAFAPNTWVSPRANVWARRFRYGRKLV